MKILIDATQLLIIWIITAFLLGVLFYFGRFIISEWLEIFQNKKKKSMKDLIYICKEQITQLKAQGLGEDHHQIQERFKVIEMVENIIKETT